MENRIDIALSEEAKQKILDGITAIKTQMPFLLKISDTERKAMQLLDDGRKPFVENAIDLAGRNAAITPGTELLAACQRDFTTYSSLVTIENELMQLLEMVHDTKQLAGAEAYEVSRFIYMKAKMALKMKVPGMQTIVDELGKLYKQSSASSDDSTKSAAK